MTKHLQRLEFIIKELFTEIYGYSLRFKDQIIFAMRLAQIRLGGKFKAEIEILLKETSSVLMTNVDHISEGIVNGKLSLDQRRQISEVMKFDLFEG